LFELPIRVFTAEVNAPFHVQKVHLHKFRRIAAQFTSIMVHFTITLVVERMSNQFFTRAILSGYEHTSISWSYFCYYFIYFLQDAENCLSFGTLNQFSSSAL
jgi:hypothetical protein